MHPHLMLRVPVVQRDRHQIFDWATPLFSEIVADIQPINWIGVRLIASLQGYVVAMSGQGLVSSDLSDPLVGGEFQLQMVG